MFHRIALVGLTALSTAAYAQDTTRKDAAVVVYAAVSAREVRFTTQPVIRVRLMNGAVDSVRVIERRNLPEPVQPGTTYRDVYVAVEILGHVNAECILATLRGTTPAACAPSQDTTQTRSRSP